MGIHLHPTFVMANRAEIEAEIEAHLTRVTLLIARLDRADGDCDIEEDDPAGDPLDKGEEDEARGARVPVFGVDQTREPINQREMEAAERAERAKAMGLIKTPRGWRWP